MRISNHFLVGLCFTLFTNLTGQQVTQKNELLGYWEGAFIKGNSHQKFDVQFYLKDSNLYSLQIIEEWHPVFGEFELPVEVDSSGRISMNTGFGKGRFEIDVVNLEIIGYIEDKNPAINIHLKKVPPPPPGTFQIDTFYVNNGDAEIFGRVHHPTLISSSTAIILVGGRSCYPGSTLHNLYAKLLRKYGVTTIAYQKRGTGKSTGNCNTAKIEDLASDVNALKKYVQQNYPDIAKIGLIGSSAGGWVCAKAEESEDYDFIISIAGPSTSVRDQQFQSMDYGLDEFDLSDEAKKNIRQYTKLMFDAPATQESFRSFQKLISYSEDQGWRQLLDDTDLVDSVEAINNLWVRRHDYDPNETLSGFNKPFLAIYGEKDWIVPPLENVTRLEAQFKGREEMLTIILAGAMNHGTDVDDENIELPNKHTYWRFFRISPSIQLEIINFLQKHNLIPKEDKNDKSNVKDISGTYTIDLRPSPSSPAYLQEFIISRVSNHTFTGSFYGSSIENSKLNTEWKKIYFTFKTQDLNNTYYHSGFIQGNRVEGITFSPERDFSMPWFGQKID